MAAVAISGSIKDALHGTAVHANLAADITVCDTIGSRYLHPLDNGLLSGVRHKSAVKHAPAELPLAAVVEPLLGPMALRIADALADGRRSRDVSIEVATRCQPQA